jgi:hypothetical protein
MGTRAESFVVISAISPPAIIAMGLVMTNEQFSKELSYQLSLNILQELLISGLFTEEEYLQAQKLLLDKYEPPISSWLFSLA